MALETLKNVQALGDYEIARPGSFSLKVPFIHVDDETNTITFTIQNGPIKENGINGCQVDTIILAAKTIIEGLNNNFPCRENSLAITKLDEALMWLEARKKDRVQRGVEGYNKD